MRRSKQRAGKLGLVMVAAALAVNASAGANAPIALDAQVVDIERPGSIFSYKTVAYPKSGAPKKGSTSWRVVNNTGNCCENYLTTTRQGRLLDFGGTYINYTDDRGKSWKSVRPLQPLVNGEGAIAMGPNGDVLGVEWDPYSGDHLLSFKYDVSEEKWFYNEVPLHAPFYDREWIGVVPGPFEINGEKVPYITFIKGAWPSKELWLYSTDGVNYLQASSKFVDRTLNGVTEKALKTKRAGYFDWIQANSNTGLTPLGNGRALAAPDWPFNDEWSLFDRDTRSWTGYRFASGDRPTGRFQTDSAGRLHNLVPQRSEFTYRISTDGGRTWRSTSFALPKGHVIEEFDFRANRFAGVGAVGVHAHDNKADKDRDLVYKLDITSNRPRLTRRQHVGEADIDGSSGVGASVRFDFETITIFPDGRVAVSFYDSTTTTPSQTGTERISPAVAIEQRTSLEK
ncbi:MAG: hypothetical protein ACRDK3_17120 [Actinomycetota bacterium]